MCGVHYREISNPCKPFLQKNLNFLPLVLFVIEMSQILSKTDVFLSLTVQFH
ncbi:hypothetical protein HMPREF1128_0868 [Haemophilus sputorum HK 2154]|nr:hypothetical protein HMPREF1128_0868 [Haemophilus sputorum HK 2154]